MTDNTQSGSDNDVTRKHPSTGVEADKIKDTQELDEILNEVTSFDVYKHPEYIEEAKQSILDWHTSKLNEAIREEWALISEVAHSANITAELFIGKAREDRLAELDTINAGEKRREMMTSPADTNQASEELRRAIGECLGIFPEELDEYLPNNVGKKNIDAIQDLIRTEKLKLLAEVRKRVVGEKKDQEYRLIDTEYASIRKEKVYLSDGIIRNKLRSKQRIELAKLEAEL